MEEFSNRPTKNIPTHVLTRYETARYLRVSLPILDSWRNRENDPIPCVKVGNRILFSLPAVDNWFDRQMKNNEVI